VAMVLQGSVGLDLSMPSNKEQICDAESVLKAAIELMRDAGLVGEALGAELIRQRLLELIHEATS
jgi:hypothetical protein